MLFVLLQSWFYAVTECSTVPNFQVECEKGAGKRSIEIRKLGGFSSVAAQIGLDYGGS